MTPLRQRMLEDMQQVSRFARHFGRSPMNLHPEDIRAYRKRPVEPTLR
jgi:hypothetical protein